MSLANLQRQLAVVVQAVGWVSVASVAAGVQMQSLVEVRSAVCLRVRLLFEPRLLQQRRRLTAKGSRSEWSSSDLLVIHNYANHGALVILGGSTFYMEIECWMNAKP
jgi:hypothetical protein